VIFRLSVFLSTNTTHATRYWIMYNFQVSRALVPKKYLGMPSMVRRKKKTLFATYVIAYGREFKVPMRRICQ